MSRQQTMMANAADNVKQVNSENSEIKAIYEGICQNFPVLIRTCGLCQAMAFVEAQAAGGGDRGRANELLREHMASVLHVHGLADESANPTNLISSYSTRKYALATRMLLSALIYYKRFVKSVLA